MEFEEKPDGRPSVPTAVLLAGLGLVAASMAWNLLAPATGEALRALAVAAGLLAVGCVLALRIPWSTQPGAVGLWAIGAAAALAGSFSLSPGWDSISLLFGILAGAGIVATLLAAVPPVARRVLASLLIAYHFAAIFCAITVVAPPVGAPPFLSLQAYVRLFHSYLIATNLNNGYHFYAPDPGPCALAWFRVQWDDGASAWVRIPDHGKVANHLERRRLGALATVITQTEALRGRDAERLAMARIDAGREHDPPIPVSDIPMPAQYREPGTPGKMLLSSFARYVARTTPHPEGGSAKVSGVKVYSVEYWPPTPQHFNAGQPPLDPTLYFAYYMGDFDAAGRLKQAQIRFADVKREDGTIERRSLGGDPFLYWRLPITRLPFLPQKPKPGEPPLAETIRGEQWKGEGRVINFVRIHAGDGDKEAVP